MVHHAHFQQNNGHGEVAPLEGAYKGPRKHPIWMLGTSTRMSEITDGWWIMLHRFPSHIREVGLV